ncbi:DUF6966 domain-containing protein [Brevundimonas poindexterae]|uniref:DUF6966 domain-containing protein n=1 Tax=Brevundimonas poindexterae TaxID=74325 RepID=UPI00384AF4BB
MGGAMFRWLRRKSADLHPEVAHLAALMREIEDVVRGGGAARWANQVSRCADIVERSDGYGVERFLQLYGGMGSINDLSLHRNGVPLVEENDRLGQLLSEAFELASRLKRSS